MSDSGPRPRPGPLRILHAPTDVGGNPTGLSRAERALGAASDVAVTQRSPMAYDVDFDLDLASRGKARRLLARMSFAARHAARYDVFHFNFGQTLLPRLGATGVDLPVLRALGKRLFMTFQGCDARRTGYCRAHCAISCCGNDAGDGLCRLEQDADKTRAVRYAARHCHRLFCLNPDLLHTVPAAEFVPYASVDLAAIGPVAARRGGPLRIVHAPTSRLVKGTEHVLRAFDALPADAGAELVLVENVPHARALERYRDADVVVDQLKVGWYGAFAVEMMAMGKPVVCYVREADLALVPRAMARELPIVRADPDNVAEVLRGLVAAPEKLAEIGRRSRAYVERWHDPLRIARRMLAVYADSTRAFWEEAEPTSA